MDEVILSRVPRLFLFLGGVYFAIQLFAWILLENPPSANPVPFPAEVYEEIIPQSEMFTFSTIVVLEHGQQTFPIEDAEEDQPHSTLRYIGRLLLSPYFVALWFIFLLNDQAIMAATGLYKAFGLTFSWMDDDAFLTLIGSLGSLAGAGGRLAWGLLSDHFHYKVSRSQFSSETLFTIVFCSH